MNLADATAAGTTPTAPTDVIAGVAGAAGQGGRRTAMDDVAAALLVCVLTRAWTRTVCTATVRLAWNALQTRSTSPRGV